MHIDNAGELKLFEEKKRSDNGDHTSVGGDEVSPWVSEDSEDGRMELGDNTGGSENGETEATQHVKGRHKEKGRCYIAHQNTVYKLKSCF